VSSVLLSVNPSYKLNKISKYLYSSFAEHLGRCIYGGLWVGEKSIIKNENGFRIDSLEALKKLEIPVLRWPGGCFADNYHWMDGIGPRALRPKRNNIWWKQPENNAFGTDEFMRLCKFIGSEPYLAINVGSGSVQEAMNWIEYCNSCKNTEFANLRIKNGNVKPYNVKYWGIGNEAWGCGGAMTAEYYADLYRRFATYIRQQTDENVKLITCGSNPELEGWDQKLLENLESFYFHLVDYIAIHIYTGAGISQCEIDSEKYYKIINDIDITEKRLRQVINLTGAYSKKGKVIKVILDEWGTWYKEADISSGLNQQSLLLDAIFAGLNFHLFHQLSGDLFMTNMAQTVNVLQSFILTRGPEMVLTPTYHLYDMYREHRDKYLLPANIKSPKIKFPDGLEKDALSVSCSLSENGKQLFMTIINIDLNQDYTLSIKPSVPVDWVLMESKTLNAKSLDSKNTFKDPDDVIPVKLKVETLENVIIRKHSVNSFSFIIT
jgi:alpha-L-arabinofuranosidase